MVLKIDPRYRLLWRSPTSLQFGVDSPPVVLSNLSSADDRLIAALVAGVSRSGLSMIGADAGGQEAEVAKLLEAVSPVLLPVAEDVASQRQVALNGVGLAADGIESTLRASGITVHRDEQVSDACAAHVNFAIIIAQFVIEPELHGAWLRHDVPHLAVVFGDTRVRLGPVIEPGVTPCLYCLERWATDADPARPAIASQLWGKRSPAETALVASEVVALVSRYTVARLSGQPQDTAALHAATSRELEVATGLMTERAWHPHPECACLSLPANPSSENVVTRESLFLSESDWGDVHRETHHSPPTLTRKDADAAVPA